VKPTLLFVSPVVPSLTGNGVAMRAGVVLEALAYSYRVSVLTALLQPAFTKHMPASLRQLCEDVIEIPASQIGGSAAYERQLFDVVHVFRLASLQAAGPYLKEGRTQARHLDLDDIESKTRRRIAALQRQNGLETLARRTEAAARNAEMLEVVAFRRFGRIYVCSEGDRRELRERCQAEVVVLPNVVRPAPFFPPRAADGTWRLLFVGTLGYYPNEDAVVHFCTNILPLIRATAACKVELVIAGIGGSPQLRVVAREAGARLAGAMPDLTPVYQSADAVIVPIRAGGGTRIKILEAFTHGRPVISSTIGAEGIDARAEEHLLIADTPEVFAYCCVRVMTDRLLWQRLAANALQLTHRVYTPEILRSTVKPSGLL
jgi:glycosyltransferase involved in cell wall biosynthesis